MAGGFDPLAGFTRATSPKPKAKAPAKRPAKKAAPPAADRAITRAVRTVGKTTTRAAVAVPAAARRVAATAPRPNAALSRFDAITAEAQRAVNRQAVSPEQQALRERVRAAYVNDMGDPLGLGEKLYSVAKSADPAITVTEKLTKPFTTPQVVAGALIEGDPRTALENLVTLSYRGKNTFPSEALNRRGWIPATGASHYLLGLGADVAPSFLVPGFKGAGRARGLQAARALSRVQNLPISKSARALRQDISAHPLYRAAGDTARAQARDLATRRQQRATRLQPGRGPDIITNPRARVVPQRAVTGAEATKAGRPLIHQPERPAATPLGAPVRTSEGRRIIERLPYPVAAKVEKALREFDAARARLGDVTARTPTPLQAARAGIRQGREEAALTAAERATLARIRRTEPTLTGAQLAQIEARLPGGATSAAARPPALRDYGRLGPDLPVPPAPRGRLPRIVNPKAVPYAAVHEASRTLESATTVARDLVRASGAPSAASLSRAGELLGRAKAAVAALPRSPEYGMGAGRAGTYNRLVNAIGRVVALRQSAGARPSPQALVSAGRELEAASTAYRATAAQTRAATVAGRQRVRGLGPPEITPSATQLRAAAPAAARSVFDTRPRTARELRSSPVTPLEGRQLPGLRLRVNEARGKAEVVARPVPTPKQISRAARKFTTAEQRLNKAAKSLKQGVVEASQRIAAPHAAPAPSARQTSIAREAFTASHEREWIDANMAYESALRGAAEEAPLGINITAPWNRRGPGITIPLATKAASAKVKYAFNASPLATALTAYRVWIVSRYGPHPVVRQGAIAADDVTRMHSAETAKFIRNETKAAGLNVRELEQASAWLEGTARGVVSDKVKAYARKMNDYTERQFDEFVQAGGQVKRFGQHGLDGGIDRQYVYHLLPPGEWDKFVASAFARRQMLYGKRPGFTKHREVLTIEALKRAGYHPLERLDELTLARAMAHHRALAEMELSRSVAKRFGKPAAEAPDGWQRIPSQFVDADTMVPLDVAQTLRNVIESRLALPGNAVSRKLQQANQWWKEWALLTTGYDIRNQIGDSALVFQATMNPVAPLMALTFGAKTLMGKGRVGGRSHLTSAEARRIAATSGQRQAGLFGGDILADVASVEHGSTAAVKPGGFGSPLAPMRSVKRGVRAFRTGRESLNRTGIMTRELRKGEGAVHASRVARETVFDYGDVGKAVYRARRSPIGAPFITWTAKNLPRQVRLAVENPAQLSATLAGLESLNQQTGGWPKFLQPDWFRQKVPVPIPGYGNTDLSLPVGSLNLIPSSPDRLGDAGRNWYQQLGPAYQAAPALFGMNPLTGASFDEINGGMRPANPVEEFLQKFPVTRAILGPPSRILSRDAQGNKRPVPAVNARGSWLLGQISPGLSTAGRLADGSRDPFYGLPRGPVFGHTRQPFFDPVAAEAKLRSLGYRVTRELIPDFNARMKAEAPGWRKGDPIPPSLRGRYLDIIRMTQQATIITALLKANRTARP